MSAPRHAIDSSIDSSIQLSSRAGIMRPLLPRAASSEAPLMSLVDLKDSADGTSPDEQRKRWNLPAYGSLLFHPD